MLGCREVDYQRNNEFLLHEIWTRPSTKKSCPGSHEFTISIDYSSVTSVITINSLCQNSAQDYRRMTLFTRKLCTIGVEEMVVIFKIWHLLTTQVIHTNGVKCFWRRGYMYSQTTEDDVAILTNGSP